MLIIRNSIVIDVNSPSVHETVAEEPPGLGSELGMVW